MLPLPFFDLTPEFAAHAIAQWWADPARPRFPHEDKLFVEQKPFLALES